MSLFSQTTDHVLMIRPDHFDCNLETLEDNSFMHEQEFSVSDVVASHQRFIESMEKSGIIVDVYDGTEDTPDACFPNNWFSTHASSDHGSYAMLYPMKAPSRRLERRADIIEKIKAKCSGGIIDLSQHELHGRYFEGTGSLVLDRVNAVAFVALSQRSHEQVAKEWQQQMSSMQNREWQVITFEAAESQGAIIYHTNVMMAVLDKVTVVCLQCIAGEEQRRQVREGCAGRTIIEITQAQVASFCANIIQVGSLIIMSDSAYGAFSAEQRRLLEGACQGIIRHPLGLMQSVSGGGIRCCIAELF